MNAHNEPGPGGKTKILIAEDDRTTRLVLTRTLQGWGYDVIATEDGEAAWRALCENNVRLVLSDWEMPELDGPGLCERIRTSERRYAYIILLTSHGASSMHVVEGLDAGADDYVAKPFNPAELRARLSVGRRILSLQDDLAGKNQELARANAELSRIATTDPLLQIGNRRSFEDVLAHTHQTARNKGTSYAVFLTDIDHFKGFNDRHGHAFGDKVLASVASTLRESLGSDGQLFRYGGEEIIAVAPSQTDRSLRFLGERLRESVETMLIWLPSGERTNVTVSVGAALFEGAETISCQVVVDHADASLYHAKRNGRNRLVCWPYRDARPPRTSQF